LMTARGLKPRSQELCTHPHPLQRALIGPWLLAPSQAEVSLGSQIAARGWQAARGSLFKRQPVLQYSVSLETSPGEKCWEIYKVDFFSLSLFFFSFSPFPLLFTAPLQTLQQNTPTLQETFFFFLFWPFFFSPLFLPLQILEEESGRVEQSRSKHNFASYQASQQLAASGETFFSSCRRREGRGALHPLFLLLPSPPSRS